MLGFSLHADFTPQQPPAATPASRWATWKIPVWLWGFGAILIASGVARLVSVVLVATSATAPAAADEFATQSVHYVANALPAVSHLVCGLIFALAGPLQFSQRLRAAAPRFHRQSGYAFVLATVFIGVSGLYMNAAFPPVGGWLKLSANWIFGVLLLLSVGLALVKIFQKDVVSHRAWMIRTFAIGMGVATQRWVLLPLFMVMGEFNDTMIGVGVWAGWVLNVVVAEAIIRRRPLR